MQSQRNVIAPLFKTVKQWERRGEWKRSQICDGFIFYLNTAFRNRKGDVQTFKTQVANNSVDVVKFLVKMMYKIKCKQVIVNIFNNYHGYTHWFINVDTDLSEISPIYYRESTHNFIFKL